MSRTGTTVTTSTENTVTFVQNQLSTGFVTIGNEADVSLDWLFENRERLEKSLSTWLSDQALKQIQLEIRDGGGNVLEQYIFDVSYDHNQSAVEFPVEDVCESVNSYSHVEDAYLCIRTITDPEKRSKDFGLEFHDAPETETKTVGSFGAGHINVDVQKALRPGRAAVNLPPLPAGILSGFVGVSSAVGYLLLLLLLSLPVAFVSLVTNSAWVISSTEAYMIVISVVIAVGMGLQFTPRYWWSGLVFSAAFLWSLTEMPLLTDFVSYSPFGIRNSILIGAFLGVLLYLIAHFDDATG